MGKTIMAKFRFVDNRDNPAGQIFLRALCAMSEANQKAFNVKSTDKVGTPEQGNYEVTLTVDGFEFDFITACLEYGKYWDEEVAKAAQKLADEKLEKIYAEIDAVHEMMVSAGTALSAKIAKKLGIKEREE